MSFDELFRPSVEEVSSEDKTVSEEKKLVVSD